MSMRSLEDLEEVFERGMTAMESEAARQTAEQMGEKCVREIKRETPVISGNLRRRWYSEVQMGKNDILIHLKNDADYAAAVNDGHRQEPGRYVPQIKKRLKASFVEGKHMLERGIAAYQDNYLQDDLEKMAGHIRDAMKGGS